MRFNESIYCVESSLNPTKQKMVPENIFGTIFLLKFSVLITWIWSQIGVIFDFRSRNRKQ